MRLNLESFSVVCGLRFADTSHFLAYLGGVIAAVDVVRRGEVGFSCEGKPPAAWYSHVRVVVLSQEELRFCPYDHSTKARLLRMQFEGERHYLVFRALTRRMAGCLCGC